MKRASRWDKVAQSVRMTAALIDVGEERQRQLEIYGDQHYDNGIVADEITMELERSAKTIVNDALDYEILTWMDILREEYSELANSQVGDAGVVDQLVQVAAVCVAWVEDIRQREGYEGDQHGSQLLQMADMGITPAEVMKAAASERRQNRAGRRQQKKRALGSGIGTYIDGKWVPGSSDAS
jgi:hypothetical protein